MRVPFHQNILILGYKTVPELVYLTLEKELLNDDTAHRSLKNAHKITHLIAQPLNPPKRVAALAVRWRNPAKP